MTKRYTYTTSLNRGGDTPTWEGEVTVSFTMTPGEPVTPPSYASGGSPGCDAGIDDMRLEKVDGKPRPWGMYSGYVADEDNVFEREVIEELEEKHLADLLAEAAGEDQSDADYHAEARREDALLERGY